MSTNALACRACGVELDCCRAADVGLCFHPDCEARELSPVERYTTREGVSVVARTLRRGKRSARVVFPCGSIDRAPFAVWTVSPTTDAERAAFFAWPHAHPAAR